VSLTEVHHVNPFARQSTTNGAARKAAALALGVIAPDEAETSLLTALSDSGDDVRYFAADALGDVRTAAVIRPSKRAWQRRPARSSVRRCWRPRTSWIWPPRGRQLRARSS
jgi:hypothetical protein